MREGGRHALFAGTHTRCFFTPLCFVACLSIGSS